MHELKIGDISIVWYGHASFLIKCGKNIFMDPYVLPPNAETADIILVTHEHFDHCAVDKIKSIRGEHTKVFGPPGVMKKIGFGSPMNIDKRANVDGVHIEAVDAYNTNKFRAPGQPFHPRGLGVGYVIEVNGKRIYHAGDTDNIPEMNNLENIDAALLPIGGTYTMTVQEAASAALTFRPRFLVPMHYNSDKYGVSGISADPTELSKALAGKGITVNILEPTV